MQGVVGTGARALESSDGREQVAEREAGPEVGPVKKKKKKGSWLSPEGGLKVLPVQLRE